MKTDFWNVELCSLIDVDRCFRGEYCLHQQCNEKAMHKKSSGDIKIGLT
jgi:hypothetical protein